MEPGKEQKIEQLEKVLQSRTLQNSENLKAFLRFVVEKTLADETSLISTQVATSFRPPDDYYRASTRGPCSAGRFRRNTGDYTPSERTISRIDLPKCPPPVFSVPHAERTMFSCGTRTSAGLASNGHPTETARVIREAFRHGQNHVLCSCSWVVHNFERRRSGAVPRRELRGKPNLAPQLTRDFRPSGSVHRYPESPSAGLSNPTVSASE